METDNTTVETVESTEVSHDVDNNQPSDFQAPQSQSELDSIVNKAVQTALKNHKKGEEARVNEAIAKALQKEQDYSKLSAAERASKEFEDQKAEFEKQVAQFEFEKLNMAVKEDLVSKGLPVELADMFSHAENALRLLKWSVRLRKSSTMPSLIKSKLLSVRTLLKPQVPVMLKRIILGLNLLSLRALRLLVLSKTERKTLNVNN